MIDRVDVRKLSEYWDKFIVDGIRKNERKEDIRNQLVEAFREEMFGLMKFRLKVDDLREAPQTEKNMRKVETVARETFKRWNQLCNHCRRFKETRDIIHPEDLKWEEEGRDASEEADYNENDVGEDGLPIVDED